MLPLLGEELIPQWCKDLLRALFVSVDGLLDAIPGILVMTAPTLLAPAVTGLTSRRWGPPPALDQRLGGGATITVAVVVGLPRLAAIFVATESAGPVLDRPCWETDPAVPTDVLGHSCPDLTGYGHAN